RAVGAGTALSVRACVPRRFADPHRRAATGRQPARVGVRRAARAAYGDRLAFRGTAVEGGAAGRAGYRDLDGAPRVRHAAGSTVSHLRSPRQQECELMSSPVYDLADRYVERFAALDPLAATGEGIAGH